MFINLSILKRNREFRLLFIGQTVSLLGSMISYVAIPYQIYELTKSNLYVGSVSLVQLAAILLFGIIGGAVADRLNRRRVMLICESIMMIVMSLFILNSLCFHKHLVRRTSLYFCCGVSRNFFKSSLEI